MFYAINDLRIIHKFHSKEINFIFENFGEFIHSALISNKTCLVKNILYFVYEIVQNRFQNSINENILCKLLHLLLKLEIHHVDQIKKMS